MIMSVKVWLRSPPSHLRVYLSHSFLLPKQWLHIPVTETTPKNLLLLLDKYLSRSQLLQLHCQLITIGFYNNVTDKVGGTIWNKLLREYSQGSFPVEAFKLYKQIQDSQKPFILMNSFTISFFLKACANLMELDKGNQIHAYITKVGFEIHIYVQTALLNMYLMCRSLSEAICIFDKMTLRNQVTWNVMVTGLTKWGEVDHATSLFERMPCRNVVSWTGLIDGYTRANRPKEALTLFMQMMAQDTRPSNITILTILPAASNLGNLYIGQSLHAYTVKSSYNASDIRISNSLIHMYGNCGSIESALRIFKEISYDRNLVSWTTLISVFAMHGMAKEAVEQFEKMKKLNLKPNRVTFLSVLHACSHGGLVEEGLKLFQEMIQEYGIMPEIKHYGCVVDMVGRSGRLEEAEKKILAMPMKENVILWRSLLAACTFHGNAEMGERIMKKIMETEKGYGGDYILLSNIFALFGRFDDVQRVRSCMDERNVVKVAGNSLIDGLSRGTLQYRSVRQPMEL
ncbi:pentatricopeptide repeat-containing protein At1g09220, mitochondrial-like [Aristolochia californica]|uniref:pentatricopeptide repeat-containing protein At1g09220, mitochondrial-like n=1 Tax=Aristolochia californica TaxID=171875 RepID=UPI0035E1D09B